MTEPEKMLEAVRLGMLEGIEANRKNAAAEMQRASTEAAGKLAMLEGQEQIIRAMTLASLRPFLDIVDPKISPVDQSADDLAQTKKPRAASRRNPRIKVKK